MPFMSYQISDEDAVYNAGRFLKEADMDAVKLEGGRRVITRIKAIADAGMLVMGHIGLTPQSSGVLGGFKAQEGIPRARETSYWMPGPLKKPELSRCCLKQCLPN